MSRHLAVIAGVGPGLGAALARRYAAEYDIVLLSRSLDSSKEAVNAVEAAGAKAHAFSVDVADTDAVNKAFEKINATGSVAAAVFNAGGTFKRGPFLELTTDDFRSAIGVNLIGAVNFSQNVLRSFENLKDNKHPPSLIFTGATASVKSNARSSAFATSKFALRALAFSLAKEFGPKQIHIAHVVVDGVIDIPKTKEYKVAAKLSPDDMADGYFWLSTQKRSAFTFEIDIRPDAENW